MSTSGTALSGSNLIQFDKTKQFLDGNAAAGIQVSADASPDILKALKDNSPFPDRQIELGNISVHAEVGHDISFAGSRGNVSFNGSASGFAGIGIYKDPSALLTTLNPSEETAPALNLSAPAGSSLYLLRWGFDLKASASGSIALGAGLSATFGVDGQKEGLFATIRCLPPGDGARNQLTKLAQSWILPSRVNNISQVEPGTWLFCEIDGSLGLKLGAQFGYDFNWVRALPITGISGDIGLRIQLGASIALGFSAQGRYGVVLSRDPLDPAAPADKKEQLRLRVFKFAKKGWNFNFNANASVTSSLTGMPSDYKEFIGAIFGLHSAQFLNDLQLLNKWSNKDSKLPDLFADIAVDEGLDLLQKVSGIDPRAEFEKAKGFVTGLLDKWNQIDHTVATAIWKLIPEKDALNKIAGIANQIGTATPDSLAALLQKELSSISFFQTPEGKWLEAAAGGRILTAITSTQAFADLQRVANFTTSILDGSKLQDGLTRLKSFIDDKLDIQEIEAVVNQTTFDSLNGWVKAKLSAFLAAKIDFTALNKIRDAISKLDAMGQSFFDKAIQALNRQYSFAFAETYQSSTTRTALIDVTFDFAVPNPALSTLLHRALDGDFGDLLLSSTPGVTLNLGTLTHDIQRHNHIDVTLPHFQMSIDHFNDALATANSVHEDDGRILVYDLDAKDIFTVSNRRQSSLTIGAHLALPTNNVVRHSTRSLSYSYSYKQAVKNMRRAQLDDQLKPYIDLYLPKVFSPGTPGTTTGSYNAWVGDMDKLIDEVDFNGTNNFGNTLLSLELSLPEEAVAAWINAPSDDKSSPAFQEYMDMSRNLQRKLKELIPFYFFADAKNYTSSPAAAQALLAWSAIPPMTAITLSADGGSFKETSSDLYWNFPDSRFRHAMLNNRKTLGAFSPLLQAASNRLANTPGLEGFAGDYDPRRIGVILAGVEAGTFLNGLLFVEANLIDMSKKAGFQIAKLRSAAVQDPVKAIALLSQIGSDMTSLFNSKLSGIYGGDATRPLATMLFVEAGAAFNQIVPKSNAVAKLEIAVLRQSAAFPPANFPDNALPDPKDIVCHQVLLNLGA